MRARDIAAPFPAVLVTARAIDAARLLARQHLPGLIVVDESDSPLAVLPGTQVLQMALPAYCVEDPTLARVVDEATADGFVTGLDGRSVGDCLPPDRGELPAVDPDATVLEVAALMTRARTPLVAMVDETGRLLGAVTLGTLLARVVGA